MPNIPNMTEHMNRIAKGYTDADIAATRSLLADRSVLSKPNTCLAPELYQLHETGALVLARSLLPTSERAAATS